MTIFAICRLLGRCTVPLSKVGLMIVVIYIMIAGTVDSFVKGLGITLCCCCFDHRHGVAVLGVLTSVLSSVR